MTTAEFVVTWVILEIVGLALAVRFNAGDFVAFILVFVLPIPTAVAVAVLAGGVPL
jgi:hypothetical protein